MSERGNQIEVNNASEIGAARVDGDDVAVVISERSDGVAADADDRPVAGVEFVEVVGGEHRNPVDNNRFTVSTPCDSTVPIERAASTRVESKVSAQGSSFPTMASEINMAATVTVCHSPLGIARRDEGAG